ncbi:ATP-binding cassette domain-containing protein [bacterium endosymbiont of Pedicinus badii]|uniref:ATP-binding cassette domain-containing protein n=1 Tax=bacterium endosymbiont of Pedicinus badii TaxID=1719126 RepID=UPI0018A881F1|nr:ATP-binding cassette domain-containing protein [bacterium endosymbiont of Pedicinus badii]
MKNKKNRYILHWLTKSRFIKIHILYLCFFAIFIGISSICYLYVFSSSIQNLLSNQIKGSENILILLFLFLSVRIVLKFFQEILSFILGKKIKNKIRKKILKYMQILESEKIKKKSIGDWNSTIIECVEEIGNFYVNYLPREVFSFVLPLVFLIKIFSINWFCGTTILLSIPINIFFLSIIGKKIFDKSQKSFSLLSRFSGYFLNRIQGIRTIKIFSKKKKETKKMIFILEALRKKTFSILKIAFLNSTILEFFSALIIAINTVYLGFYYLKIFKFGFYETPSVALGILVFFLIVEFFIPIKDLSKFYHCKAQSIEAAKQVLPILLILKKRSKIKKDKTDFFDSIGIEAKNLIVHSIQGDKILGPVNFKILPKQKVAILGESGSGKTSIIYAIFGILPYSGSIKINGIELKKISKKEWRKNINFLSQNPYLTESTIRENITFGSNCSIQKEEIQKISKESHIVEFLNKLSDGIKTKIRKKSTDLLSYGQMQRISIARFLARNSKLLILDEPTSGLDLQSKNIIVKSLLRKIESKTSILITHKIDMIKKFDIILRIKNGKIIYTKNK